MSVITIIVITCVPCVPVFSYLVIVSPPPHSFHNWLTCEETATNDCTHKHTHKHRRSTAPCSSQKWCSCVQCFAVLSWLFGLASFYFATVMDTVGWGADWPFSFWVLIVHLGAISCRRTLPDQSPQETFLRIGVFVYMTGLVAWDSKFSLALMLLFSFFTARFHLCFHCASGVHILSRYL